MIGVILAGSALGVLMGMLCALAVLLVLRATAAAQPRPSLATVTKAVPGILAIPTSALGGPSAVAAFLGPEDRLAFLPAYAIALCVVVLLGTGYSLARLMIAVGNQIARVEVRSR